MKKKNKDVKTSGYIMLPRELLSARFATLSLHARVLYSLLLDRNELSEKNGMNDDSGNIVVFFPVEEVCERLGCGHDKATKTFRELESFGVIKRKNQGRGMSAMIYVFDLSLSENHETAENQDSGLRQSRVQDCDNTAFKTAENQDSRLRQNRIQDCDKTAGNYTEYNYTEKNYQENIYPQSISYDEMIEDVEYQIEYDVLSEREYGGVLDEIVSLIADTLCADAPSVRIAGRQVPIETVRSRFAKLTAEHIEHVIKTLEQNAVNVKNMRAYVLTAIYNSIDALEILSLEGCADAIRGRSGK